MKKSKKNLRKDSKLLVEHILNKDPLAANSVFQRLIMEAEEEREAEVDEELGLDDIDDMDDAETDDFGGDDLGGDDAADLGDDFGGDESESDIESLDNDETEKIVDDIVEINCQINAKMISNLFDKIAQLKSQIAELGLDENSREYLKYDVSIQYYSDKLQDLQNKTNPGIDQSKVEGALEKIATAIEQLCGEAGGENTDIDDINSPEEVAAENDLTDDTEDFEETEIDTEVDTEEEPEETEVDTEEDFEETETSDDEDLEEML